MKSTGLTEENVIVNGGNEMREKGEDIPINMLLGFAPRFTASRIGPSQVSRSRARYLIIVERNQ